MGRVVIVSKSRDGAAGNAASTRYAPQSSASVRRPDLERSAGRRRCDTHIAVVIVDVRAGGRTIVIKDELSILAGERTSRSGGALRADGTLISISASYTSGTDGALLSISASYTSGTDRALVADGALLT